MSESNHDKQHPAGRLDELPDIVHRARALDDARNRGDAFGKFPPGEALALAWAVRVLADRERTPPSAIGAGWIDEVIREIQEMPDRTSPEDFPEAMLVTAAELRRILESFSPSSPEASRIHEGRRSSSAGALTNGSPSGRSTGETPGGAVPGGAVAASWCEGCSPDNCTGCVAPSSTAPMFQNVGGSEQEQTDRHLPNDAELLQIGREIRDASTAKPEDALLDDVLDSSLDPEDGERLRRAQAYAKEVLDDVEAAPKSGPLKRDLNDNESLLAWAVDYLTDALAGAQGVAKGALSASSATAPITQIEPWNPEAMAPVTNALVLKVADYPVLAAEKVRGEVKQLQAGVDALFEAVREVGRLSVKFEQLLRRVMICDRNASILNGARELRAEITEVLRPTDGGGAK